MEDSFTNSLPVSGAEPSVEYPSLTETSLEPVNVDADNWALLRLSSDPGLR
jgi:hypothetical protein